MSAADLLARALSLPPEDVLRPLLVTAAINEALGRSYIIVGGTAADFHTGAYRPTDIDIIGEPLTPGDKERLRLLGFSPQGRHLVLRPPGPQPPIPVEIPGDRLYPFATQPPERIEIEPDRFVEVISLDDLMMDRAIQAADGTPMTRDDALRLAIAAYRQIDWPALENRAAGRPTGITATAADTLHGTLRSIRTEARRRIRAARQTLPDSPSR